LYAVSLRKTYAQLDIGEDYEVLGRLRSTGDDRIHFFTTATGGEKSFYYQVRVISKGTFTVGPVGADAMYQGEYRSYSGGGKVTVR
jgi:uncharacterized protein YfaS (alpha-2-macroglobulin family)